MKTLSNLCRILIIMTCGVLVTNCSGRPSGVLSKEDMAQLLADIHIGEGVIESSSRSFPNDSAKQAFLQAIYQKHGVTREEVDSSFSWYGYNMEKYMEVYDRTIEILEKRLDKAQEIAGASASGSVELTMDLQGDSVDVWPGLRWRRFASAMPNDHITFSLSTDRNWERGDVYTLRAKTIDNHQPFTFTITAEYQDGNSEYITTSMPGDGWHELRIALDSARVANKVYGIISYPSQKGEVVFVDSISLMRTRWGGHYRDVRNTVQRFNNRTKPRTSARPVTPVEPEKKEVQLPQEPERVLEMPKPAEPKALQKPKAGQSPKPLSEQERRKMRESLQKRAGSSSTPATQQSKK